MAGGLKVGLTTLGQPGGQVGTAPRAVLGGSGTKEGRDGDHVPTLDTARSARSADPTQGRYKRLEVSGLGDCRAKGDRKPDDWLGGIFSGLGSRPSGPRCG